MLEKDPLTYQLGTYAWVVGLSVFAGISSYVMKLRKGMCKPSVAELIGEIVISAFVGVITFFLCESVDVPPIGSAAIIGVSSHMGSRAIMLFENSLTKAYGKVVDK